ncbi:MAG: hypothetical protein A2Y95_12985 [Deltaproteobacteria bacterium RBG_13_65_10]|nr:MAG: hypothetical protein A2Y95_12985 [Deltaproteobacteria bacterium RBG_13_65_10]
MLVHRMRPGAASLTMAALSVALLFAGCDKLGIGLTPIGKITKNPSSFEGRDVVIRGTVVESNKIPFLNVTVFSIKDDTGQITVTTSLDLPPQGKTITVKGKVENVAILAGKSFGVSVAERERR